MDGALNTDLLGVPIEAVGFANNPKVHFGPPDWQAASVPIHGTVEIAITLTRLGLTD